MNARRLALIAALALLMVAPTGCKQIKMKLGMGYEVTDPAAGSPEHVIQQALDAGRNDNATKGWRAFMKLLHTDQHNPASLKSWETMKYASMRRKVDHFIVNEVGPSFKVMRIREEDNGSITYFLFTPNSDMPTPCTVKPDPQQADAWRITRCSL